MHSFQKLGSDFGDFSTYVLGKRPTEITLHANECVRRIEAFIADLGRLGHPLCGWQSENELAFVMKQDRTLFIPSANSCIGYELHIKDDPDLQ